MRIIKRLIFIWILLIAIAPAFAQDSDEYREIKEETLEKLKADGDLDYPVEVGEKAGWLQKIFEWIADGLSWFYSLLQRGGLSEPFLYLISFIAAGVLVWLLLRSRYSWVFSRRSKEGNLSYSVHHEDIHSIDFDKEIEGAIKKEDFRLAVRLVYLRTLKLMSDYQLIYWAEGKTNNQYARELSDQTLREKFSRLSYQFNYLWYGHFDARNDHWMKADELYREISSKIK